MQEETLSLATLPRGPLSVDGFLALPPDPDHRWELAEGTLVMAASPAPRHSRALKRLLHTLDSAAPAHLEVLSETDLDLQLVLPGGPATVRTPDLVAVTRAGYDRVVDHGGLLRADEAVLVVEIVSPSTERTDRLVKLAEYADAGIAHYWIVDLDAGPSVQTHRLVDGRYEAAGPFTAPFDVTAPFGVRVAPSALG